MTKFIIFCLLLLFIPITLLGVLFWLFIGFFMVGKDFAEALLGKALNLLE